MLTSIYNTSINRYSPISPASDTLSKVFITLKPQLVRPGWVTSFQAWPIPKLGDFPEDDVYQKLALFHYESILETAAKNPQTWYSDAKDFDKLIDFLTIPGRANEAAEMFRNGFKVTNVPGGNCWKDHDCHSDNVEENILHLHDLLCDLVKGNLGGPFELDETSKFAKVISPSGMVY